MTIRKPTARSSRREEIAPPRLIRTREVRADRHLAGIRYRAQHDATSTKADLESFAERLLTHPASAFEWSRNSFEAAARFEAARQLHARIDFGEKVGDDYDHRSAEAIIRECRRMLYDEVLRGALYPERSTSPQSNEMSLTLNSKRAEWLRALDHAIEAIEEDRHL